MESFLALGTNLGDRDAHLAWALRRLADEAGRITGVSSIYETDPVGYEDQPAFLNMVVRVETSLAAPDLLALARRIEEERGRERTFRNAPRTLDIDILLHGDRPYDGPGLTIPHPRMGDRAFVLLPLLEIDPEVRDPVTGVAYGATVRAEAPGVRRLYAGERLLNEEVG